MLNTHDEKNILPTSRSIDELNTLFAANQHGTKLNLASKSLADGDIPALLLFLNQHPEIKELSLRLNSLTEKGAATLAANKTLTTLDISGNNIGVAGATALAANQTLTTLNVRHNKIGDAGAVALAANKLLKTLNISLNKIGVAGATALAANQTLTTLDVSFYNDIGVAGATALAKNQTLTTLDVSWNNIGVAGATALAANQTLTTLNVSNNNIGNAGATALAANQTLMTLNVCGNKIGDTGATALAANQTLTTLDISYNQIGAKDATALIEAIKQRIDLNNRQRNAWIAFTPFLAFVRANRTSDLKYSAMPLKKIITELTGTTASTISLDKASHTKFFKQHVDVKAAPDMKNTTDSKDAKQQPLDLSSSSSAPKVN